MNATRKDFLSGVAAIAAGALCAVSAFAGSEGPDGSDYVVSEDSGNTYMCSTAIGNYSRLVKRGAGEVELTVAANGFAGSVVVEAGTLTIKNKDAVGSGTPVTVVSGATLYLKLPGLGQSYTAFPDHVVTIAGNGVGNNGALRYSNTSGSATGTTYAYADNLLTKLVLSDDATIEVPTRWGLFSSGSELDLAGHTLTRIGGSTWMIWTHITAGTILNTAGGMTLQAEPIIDEGVTIAITNSSDNLSLFGVRTGSDIKGTIQLAEWRCIKADNGAGMAANHIGNVHLVGTGSIDTGSDKTISVDGAVTGVSGKDLNIYGTGDLYLNGPVTLQNQLNKNGSGTLWLNGAADINNTTWFYDGTIAMTSTATRTMYVNVCGNSTAFMSDGTLRFKRLRVTNGGADGSATYRQTGGTFQDIWGDTPIIGDNSNQRGFFALEGGVANFNNTVNLANNIGSYGALRQTGGTFNVVKVYSSGSDTLMYIGRKGHALFVQTGGTNDIGLAMNNQTSRAIMGYTNSVTTMTVSGTGTVFRTGGFQIGTADGISSNILNLANGAVFRANRFRRQPGQPAGSFSCVNADGGIMMPTYPWGWTQAGYTDSSRKPDHFVLWEKGLVIDTSENESMSTYGGGESSMPFLFDAPTGKGVESVALPASGDYTTATYYGIMPIVFEDATGWGASAYAEYDYTAKKFTKVVVTSRGCDYSDGAKAYIEGPERTNRYECVLSLTSNEGKCGPLVKRGAPDLWLYAANTINGGIIVEQGKLLAGQSVVIPANTPVTVAHGATLDLNNSGSVTVSTFAGAGTVTNGSVAVKNAVRATCADLFAGKAAFFANDLTFADGAVFEITDAENLPTYADAGRAIALSAGGDISRVPAVRLTTSAGAPAVTGDSWSLRRTANGKSLKFGRDIGMMLLLR